MRRHRLGAWGLAVALLAGCGDPAGRAVEAGGNAHPSAPTPSPPTGPLTTVVQDGSKWAVLPAGSGVARAVPPAGFVRRSEFLMFDDGDAVRFVEKFVRETDGRPADILDVHSVRATTALRDAIETPPPGHRRTTVHGEPALVSDGRPGTVATLAWIEGTTMAVELYGVGDVSEADLHDVAESVRIVPLAAPRRLEVST